MRISYWSSDVCSSDLLGRAGFAHHLDDFEAGGAAHDRIVDQHHALARDQRAIGIVLELDAEVADLVARLDEGAPDIMRADDPQFERNVRFLSVADRRRTARIGNGDHQDRKSVVMGKGGTVRVDSGGRSSIKKKKTK